MSELHTKKLGDVVELVIDNRGRNPKSYEERGIPVIDNFLITSEGKARLSEVKRFINDETYDSFLRKYIQEGDVLMTLVGNGYGKVATTPKEKCAIIQNTIGLRCNDQNDNQYLYYLLRSSRDALMNLNRGAAQPSIKVGDVLDLEFQFPLLKEQQRVAGILKGIDDKIELNTQTNQTLEQIAQAIFKSWFVDFEPVKAKMAVLEAGGTAEQAELAAMSVISAKDETALKQLQADQPEAYAELTQTAALFPSAMIDSELGEIPEGWTIPSIQDVAKTIKGKSYKSSELQESTTALVTLKSFNRGGGYRLDGLKEYTGKYKPEQEVFAGDLIIAYTDVTQAADVIGKPAMVISDARYEHLVISLDVAVIRPVDDDLKYYLYGVAKTEHFQQHTNAHSTGTTVLHLSKNAVPKYMFTQASDDLIKAYRKHVQPIFSDINENIEQNNTLSAYRDTLLPKLLYGALSITNTEVA